MLSCCWEKWRYENWHIPNICFILLCALEVNSHSPSVLLIWCLACLSLYNWLTLYSHQPTIQIPQIRLPSPARSHWNLAKYIVCHPLSVSLVSQQCPCSAPHCPHTSSGSFSCNCSLKPAALCHDVSPWQRGWAYCLCIKTAPSGGALNYIPLGQLIVPILPSFPYYHLRQFGGWPCGG